MRRWQQVVAGQPARTTLVATHGSFHGRSVATAAALAASPSTARASGRCSPGRWSSCPSATPPRPAPRGRARRVRDHRRADPGRGRPAVVPPPGYLAALREACDATGTLRIFDEVQTGAGAHRPLVGGTSTTASRPTS
ncbi:MAG: hypothetical protein HS111_14965 [Kofleriaceae bacterium]|nr:hypothetical protein [Kofleriaceae bacterium]